LSRVKDGSITLSGKVYASDLNSNLIALYRNIQSTPDGVIHHLKELCDEFSKCKDSEVNRKPTSLEEALTSQESYYYWIRSRFNAMKEKEKLTLLASAMLIFMNKTCFRGVYRESKNGFNVPFGNYKNPSVYDETHIRAVSELIQGVMFIHQPFTESLKQLRSGDFVYCDPPYAPESETSFVSYTSEGFDIDNHKALFNSCVEMHRNDVKFLMSNSDVDFVKDYFGSSRYSIRIINCKRSINSKNPEAKTNEVLISNY
jgi:DNA adenine methylase